MRLIQTASKGLKYSPTQAQACLVGDLVTFGSKMGEKFFTRIAYFSLKEPDRKHRIEIAQNTHFLRQKHKES